MLRMTLGWFVVQVVTACGAPVPAATLDTPATAEAEPTNTATPSGNGPRSQIPSYIEAIAVDASGRLFGSDCFGNAVFRFDGDLPVVVAGTGRSAKAGDGGLGVEAALHCPSGLAVLGTDLYIVDDGNYGVRRLDRGGIIHAVADSRPPGTRRPAVYQSRHYPGALRVAGIAVDNLGNIYIADRDHQVVRRVDGDGVMTTFAGDGTVGFAGDGGPATEASLFDPIDVVVDPEGHVYVADIGNQRIRRIDPNGIISTFAGSGEFVGSEQSRATGDGGPALDAALCNPSSLALDADGSLYVAGSCGISGNQVRKIDARGTIATVVGVGTAGHSGDGGPAVDAEINRPSGIAVDAQGNLYVAELGSIRCIRVVDTAGMIRSLWCGGT